MSKPSVLEYLRIGQYTYVISYNQLVSSKTMQPKLFANTSQFEVCDDISTMDMIEGLDLALQLHLALIYRAIPSPRGDSPLHFCDECVTASRAAMEDYNAAWEKYRTREDTTWKTVISW
jgi:hypothetical protein